jgi:hypothetical protein
MTQHLERPEDLPPRDPPDDIERRGGGSAQGLIDWEGIWSSCEERILSWRIPPNRTYRSWLEDMKAEGVLTALIAVLEYRPELQVPFVVYIRMRILQQALVRYRQEWASRALLGRGDRDDEPAGDQGPRPGDLRSAVKSLPCADRELLRRLFSSG